MTQKKNYNALPKLRWPSPVVQPAPDASVTVHVESLKKIVMASPFKALQHVYADTVYVGLTRAGWAALFERINTKALKYVPELHDCDDFAKLAAGLVSAIERVNGCGWVLDYSARHSYNVVLVVEDDGTCSLQAMEPQTDMLAEEGKGHYVGSEGIVIW